MMIWGSFNQISRQQRSLCRRRFHRRFHFDLYTIFGGLTVKSRVTRRSGHAHRRDGVAIARFLRTQLSTGAQTTDCRRGYSASVQMCSFAHLVYPSVGRVALCWWTWVDVYLGRFWDRWEVDRAEIFTRSMLFLGGAVVATPISPEIALSNLSILDPLALLTT